MGKKKVVLSLVIFIVSAFIFNVSVDAKNIPLPKGINSVINFPDVKLVDPETRIADGDFEISEEYATLIRPHSNLTFTSKGARKDVTKVPVGTSSTVDFYGDDIAGAPNSPHYLQLNKAGIYQGDYMDVRIHFKGIEALDYSKNRRIEVSLNQKTTSNHGGFLQMEYKSISKNTQSYIVVEFLKSGTEEVLDYKGTWNYKRVNDYKSISVDTSSQKMKDLMVYKYPESKVYPEKKERLSNKDDSDHYMFYEPRTHFAGESIYLPIRDNQIQDAQNFKQFYGRGYKSDNLRENFSVSFNAEDGKFPFLFSTILDRTAGWLKYESEPITKMQLPTPQIVGIESKKGIYRFEASQDMPLQASDTFYPIDYRLDVEFDTEIELIPNGFYEITDIDGNKVQDKYFKKPYISDDGRRIIFELKNPSTTLRSSDFVDNSYSINMDVKMKGDKDINGKNYKEYFENYSFTNPDTGKKETKGYYRLPIRAQYETKEISKQRKSMVSETKSKMIAEPTVTAGKTIKVEEGSSTADWKTKFKPEDLFEGIDPVLPNEKMVISFVEDKKFEQKGRTQVKVILIGEDSKVEHKEVTQMVDVDVLAARKGNIHFVDAEGNVIAPKIEKKGFENQDYDFSNEKKEIENYTFVKIDEAIGDNAIGKYPSESKEINVYYVYKMNDQKVTVNYLDEENKAIAPPKSKDYEANKNHIVKSASINGYQVSAVKVDGNTKTLDDGKVGISVKDKPVTVTFAYKSVHYGLKLEADRASVAPRGVIDYTLDVTSGMKYPEGSQTANYKDVEISIPIDDKIANISNISVVNGKNEVIGSGQYADGKITARLTEEVKDTESIKVKYTAEVKDDVSASQTIKAKATMTANYEVNDEEKAISHESNTVTVTVKESDKKNVTLHYLDEDGKKISDPVIKTGKEFQPYSYTDQIKDIPGYKYIGVDETKGLPIEGVFREGSDDENVYFVYELAEFELTTNYVDESGEKIAKETTQKIISGTGYDIDSAVVPGYKVKAVKVDDKDAQLTADNKVHVTAKDSAIGVTFVYDSVHFSVKLKGTPDTVVRKGTIDYTLDVTSGMIYPEGKAAANYKDVEITVPIDTKIDKVENIKVLDSEDKVIGTGEYDEGSRQIKASLTKAVKDTENFKLTYKATVSNDAADADVIKAKASVKATYSVNGTDKDISRDSKEVSVVVASSDKKKITIHYLDEKRKKIADPVIKVGEELQDYNYKEDILTIPGYVFDKVDEDKGLPIKGTFKAGNDDENIYVVYKHDELNVTVNFEDENGKKISKESVKKYLSGKDYTIDSVAVPGYKVKSVKVDGKEKTLTNQGKVDISVVDKAISIVFVYESVHYSLKLDVDKSSVSQGDTLDYTLEVKSGMVYPEGKTADNYKNVKITIPIDERLTDLKAIKVLNAKNESIGMGTYDEASNVLNVLLEDSIQNTENIKLTYSAKVKDSAKTNDEIKAKATMQASYEVNGSNVEIERQSNEVKTTISGGLKLASAPTEIDFGEVKYLAKKQRVDDPTLNNKLEVVDTRSSKKNWELQVSIDQPLKDGDRLLPSKLRFKTDDDDLVLNSDAQTIYKNTEETDRVVISDDWGTTSGSKGIKLEFDSTDSIKVGTYTGKVRWTVVDSK